MLKKSDVTSTQNCMPKQAHPPLNFPTRLIRQFSFFLFPRADNLRVHMKIHGDPTLLTLPMEKLLAPGFDESMEERGQPGLNTSSNVSFVASQTLPTNNAQPPQQVKRNQQARIQDNKVMKTEHKTGNINNIVDSVIDMSQGQAMNVQSVANHLNTNLIGQHGGQGAQTITVPATGYQIVTTGGTGEAAYIPTAALQPANEQTRYPNMETISASAMMLMTTTNYFQPLGNSHQ